MPIITLAVDETGDLYLIDGSNFGIIEGLDACIQDVGQATKKVRGENQFNSEEGIDYFGSVFSPSPDYDKFRSQLVEAALSVPDTVDVTSVTIEKEGDELSYEMKISTVYGSTQVTGFIAP